jgi:hypothetical protein
MMRGHNQGSHGPVPNDFANFPEIQMGFGNRVENHAAVPEPTQPLLMFVILFGELIRIAFPGFSARL